MISLLFPSKQYNKLSLNSLKFIFFTYTIGIVYNSITSIETFKFIIFSNGVQCCTNYSITTYFISSYIIILVHDSCIAPIIFKRHINKPLRNIHSLTILFSPNNYPCAYNLAFCQ